MTSFFDFSARRLDGTEQPMAAFAGKVILPVNTASKCGFTRQYDGLEKLWQTYGERGLVVMGFPCNQFGAQEPGSAAEIAAFCSTSFSVSFPMFDKVEVNGREAHPIWAYLKKEAPGFPWFRDIGWNFTKFLVDRQGRVTGRYASAIEPEALAPHIEKLL
jgi:glutathione peroxidase